MNCAMTTVKYLIFLLNFIITVLGIALLIAGAISIADLDDVSSLMNDRYSAASIAITAIGGVLFIVGFFGCCGAVKKNTCMMNTYIVFLVLLMIAELAVGVTVYVYRGDIADVIGEELRQAVDNYYLDASSQESVDAAQRELQCCGASGPQDYASSTVPATCCSTGVSCTIDSVDLFNVGCQQKLVDFASGIGELLGGFTIGVAVVELVISIFSFCLARSIKNERETV